MTFTLGLDIGLVMAKGVLLGILTVITVLPSMMLLFFKPIYRLGHRSFVPRFGGKVLGDEIGLPVTETGLVLPCGAACRWQNDGSPEV